MKKFGINDQLRNKLFLIVIHRFSLVKAAMIAPRICTLRKCVNKTPQFLLFQLPKEEQRPLHTCQLWRGQVFLSLDRRIDVQCKSRNEKKKI
jgi:hypothetical protein